MPQTPSKLNETIVRPETAPPRIAVRSAPPNEVRPAFAVREFARIEMYIPMYPLAAECVEPTAHAIAVRRPSSHVFVRPIATAKRIATPAAMRAIVRYWRRLDARAASWVAP